MPTCPTCSGTVIEYDAAAGNGFCVSCGTVVEENTIVSEVTFGETSNGAAMVQGAYVAQGATRARMGGMYGNRGGGESREQTIANASRKIQNIASVLRLSEVVCHSATRLYTLAVEHKFTKGRKSMNVVAVCLYIACRQKETRNYMLIDFSDLLQVNVFELGHTYLQLVHTLNLHMPLVDPAHYISRFAALLEFGEDTPRVAADAVRLVQRFDRDWLARGRRPAGICGAALLLAARMNHFRRSVAEIVQVVKIADTTLKKRLDEFRRTPSARLNMADFRAVWLEEEMDPPAFTKGREREEAERAAAAVGEEGEEPKKKGKRGRKKGKRKRGADGVESSADDEREPALPALELDEDAAAELVRAFAAAAQARPFDPALLDEGILAGTHPPPHGPLFLPELPDKDDPSSRHAHIDPALLTPAPTQPTAPPRAPSVHPDFPPLVPPPSDPLDDKADEVLADEVAHFLQDNQGAQLGAALDEQEARRLAALEDGGDDELQGLDEDELDAFIMTEEEVRIKERVWVELNRDYLENIAARGEDPGGEKAKAKKRRKTNKPRDAESATGATASESVRNMVRKNPKYSKRINYDALKDLLDEGAGARATPHLSREEKDGLYTLSDYDKSEGEMDVIEEDAGGGFGAGPALVPAKEGVVEASKSGNEDTDGYGDEDAEGEVDEDVDVGSEKADEDWGDTFEQEA